MTADAERGMPVNMDLPTSFTDLSDTDVEELWHAAVDADDEAAMDRLWNEIERRGIDL